MVLYLSLFFFTPFFSEFFFYFVIHRMYDLIFEAMTLQKNLMSGQSGDDGFVVSGCNFPIFKYTFSLRGEM